MTNKTQIAELRAQASKISGNFKVDRLINRCLNKLEAAEASIADAEELNKHLDLAVRKAEGASEALRRRAEKAEDRIAELGGSFDELASIVGFSKERCEQTGDSPADCAKELAERTAKAEAHAEEVNGWYVKMKTRMLAAEAELAETKKAVLVSLENSKFHNKKMAIEQDEEIKKLKAELAVIRGEAVPYLYELWRQDDTAPEHWFLCERSKAKQVALKNQRVVELFTHPAPPVEHPDKARMDWLCAHTVQVRNPLVYGSHEMFWAQCDSDDDEEYHTTLREQVDAAIKSSDGEGE